MTTSTPPYLIDPASVRASVRPEHLEIAQGAYIVLEHLFGDRKSAIDPAQEIWTADNAERLRHAIGGNPTDGSLSLKQKYHGQLTTLPDPVHLLFAEMSFLRHLPTTQMKPQTKIDDLNADLTRIAGHPPLPDAMNDALLRHPGVPDAFDGRMEYLTFFWEHMAWLAQFVIRWAGLPDAQRQATLGDPWAFLDLTADVTPDQPGIRNVLLFLTFPLVFEPTSSDAAKRRIRDGLADSIDGVTGDDLKAVNRDILAIRAATMRHTPGPFTWWEPRWREIWDTADTTPGPAPTDPDPVAPSLPGLALPRATAELATTVYLPTTWLDEYIGLLESRHQLIVYGPPGTGKTFVARRVARHVAGDERVAVVQFHPSYAYEDFFEGLRPVTTGGNVSYRLAPGPLRRIAAAAIEDPDHPHVLIIDEINRADVARVFGELYYLLEYRDDQIALQYSPEEPFSLPKNLYLIGTMNTADRSIAMVDAAIRRRFPFMEMHPSEEPVAGVLGTYLAAVGGTAERSELLAELNSQLPGKLREFQIGPSYLMRPEAATEAGLSRVWRYDILPLLEEQLYGTHARDQVHANFGLDAIRKVLAAKRQQRLQPESALVQPET